METGNAGADDAQPAATQAWAEKPKHAMRGLKAHRARGRGRGRGRKSWKDLSSAQRGRMAVMGTVRMALMIWMLWDLHHRPADKIKGSKKLWTLAAFMQPVGPIAYLVFGRKRR